MLLNNQGTEVIVNTKNMSHDHRVDTLSTLREVLVPASHKGAHGFSIEARANLK